MLLGKIVGGSSESMDILAGRIRWQWTKLETSMERNELLGKRERTVMREVRGIYNKEIVIKMFSIRLRNNIPKAADVVPEAAVILPPSGIPDSLHLPTPYADIHRQQLTMEYKFLALNQ